LDAVTEQEKREQIAKQCEAVAHMAKVLAEVSGDYAQMFRDGKMGSIAEIVGRRTAAQMEILGNMLNEQDAVDDESDAWLDPVFAEAQRLWPKTP
jgi:hypothetical protein